MGSPAQPVAAMIRENIREQVESSQWLDRLRQEYDQLREKQQSDEHKSERCMVCTLPLGTCEHSAEWLGSVADSRDSALLEAQTVSNVDQEIDDVLGLLGDSAPVTSAPVEGDIDLGSMAWTRLEQRLSDKIGAESKSLFAPDERGWHSCVALGDQVIVVFGGFKYRAQG